MPPTLARWAILLCLSLVLASSSLGVVYGNPVPTTVDARDITASSAVLLGLITTNGVDTMVVCREGRIRYKLAGGDGYSNRHRIRKSPRRHRYLYNYWAEAFYDLLFQLVLQVAWHLPKSGRCVHVICDYATTCWCHSDSFF